MFLTTKPFHNKAHYITQNRLVIKQDAFTLKCNLEVFEFTLRHKMKSSVVFGPIYLQVCSFFQLAVK